MSKERELLRRVVSSNWQIGTITVVLHEEIEELLAQPETITPREGLAEFKKGYMIGYNVAVRVLKTKIDSVFNLIMEEDDDDE